MSEPTAASKSPLDHHTPDGVFEKATNYRWMICGLLFYATTLNYMDRSILNVLAPRLQKEFHYTDAQYGYIGNAAFSAAYTHWFSVHGLVDRQDLGRGPVTRFHWIIWTGVRRMHGGWCEATFGLGVARSFLALGEAGNFPAAIKTVAEWFPQRQRATATGIFNSGSNIGAILAFWLVPVVIGCPPANVARLRFS